VDDRFIFIFDVRAAVSHVEISVRLCHRLARQSAAAHKPTPDEAEVGVTLTLLGCSLAIC
jgi:hypothetical protein